MHFHRTRGKTVMDFCAPGSDLYVIADEVDGR